MASTRKPKRAEPDASDLLTRVRGFAALVPSGSRVLVALSGGIDSIVLLDLVRRLGARRRWRVAALHVNHQLQPAADAWARFCRKACREAGVPLRVVKVEVTPGNSIERAAREARYEALLAQPADFVALAHNQDDQAETVLLHLLRGAGVHGLVGMRTIARRVPAPAQLVRPLLDVPRRDIERYAARRKLAWIEDPSNASGRFLRNYLRSEVLPRVAARFPAYREALTRASRHAAEAAQLLDELAVQDAATTKPDRLPLQVLRGLAPARAKNVLGYFLRSNGAEIPSAERLEEALRQALHAKNDARLSIDLGQRQLRSHRGALVLRERRSPSTDVERAWQGEPTVDLPELGGILVMQRATGDGLSAARLAEAPVTIRARVGGEKLRPQPKGAKRTVKNLMQEAGVPAWERSRLPFIYCGDTLVCVPGLAIDSAFRAGPLDDCIVPVWQRVDGHGG